MLPRVAIRDYTNFVKASNSNCFTPLAPFLSVVQQYLNQWKKLYIYSIVSGYLDR